MALRWSSPSIRRAGSVLVMGALASPTQGCCAVNKASDRGEAMFAGAEALKGAIRGHRADLPPEVVKCGNCHAAGHQPRAGATQAPRIDRSLLVSTRQRRGGPPSAYDAQSFCKLVRTGIDPAYILIAREMPVYDMDDAQCASLWQFLTRE